MIVVSAAKEPVTSKPTSEPITSSSEESSTSQFKLLDIVQNLRIEDNILKWDALWELIIIQ